MTMIIKIISNHMNSSIGTRTGRTKIKIALLGDQSVGKTSIIERFVKNVFDETPNVLCFISSRLWEWIFLFKTLLIKI